MKKILALLLIAVLVVAMGVTAFAAPSAEANGVISGMLIVDDEDQDVNFTINKIDGKVKKPFSESLGGLKSEKGDKTLKVVGQYNVEMDGEPKYPLTISLSVLGVSKNSSVYVLAKSGDGVVVITPEVKGNKLTFTVEEEFEDFAIVTDGKTATKVEKENGVVSPQTGDATVYAVIAMFVSLLAIAFLPKKVKN